jgi:asparagine synthetase B (glutamine-hydrolysing)
MCGIAGFSLSERSTVNARQLGHALLSEIQWRGNMASGYAYFEPDGRIGIYKDATPGSQLPLKGLPRDAKTAVFHTRLTTHGSEHVNENNHPVISPDQHIALTHNGVIFNEQQVRRGPLKGVKLPEVDTSVIAASIELLGLDGISEIYGDAAIGWLDRRKPHELNLARIESSPVAYTWLMDGSFVYASTQRLLEDALDSMKLEYGYVFIMDERVYYNITSGIILDYQQTPEMAEYDWYQGYSSYRSNMRQLTSGNHNATSQTRIGFQAAPSEDTGSIVVNHYDASTDTWEYREGDAEEQAEAAVNAAMALMGASEDYDPFEGAMYYTIDNDGDYKTYKTLDHLETELKWYAGLRSGPEHFEAEGAVRWVEHFADLGSVGLDGETQTSWVDEPEDIYVHEDPKGESLSYIREGVGILQRMVGA